MENLQDYTQEDLTISIGTAQLGAFLYSIPFLIIFGIPFYLIWHNTPVIPHSMEKGEGVSFFIVAAALAGIIAHELIHGLTWAFFAPKGIKSMKFGIIWKWLTPYCHCKEPLMVKHYILGAIMPGLILGILPSIIALVTGSFAWFFWGMLFTLAAGGDFMIINLLRKQPSDCLIQDHPSKVGCYIYKPIK